MSKEQKIWLDGELVNQADAKISVFDHGLLYGDGVFEGIRFYNGRVFKLIEHVERLFNSAKAIMLKMPWTLEEVCDIVCETIRANELRDGYVRLVVTRGAGGLGMNPYLCETPSMFCIAASIQLYPEEYYTKGLEIVTCSTRRPSHATLSPQVKSLNYLNNVMAKIECVKAGVMEGIMLNENGTVAECTGDNLFIIKKGVIATPKISDGALDGITRETIFELCDELGVGIFEETLTRYDVYTADEVFLTGTAAEVIPVVKYDDREIGDGNVGEITKHLINAYTECVNSDVSSTEIYEQDAE
ncbi:branched-chain-amino-acid transaminase [Persicirhabdus sediminis]|uniref:Branched-chain-amino-acid aminotransferase n=1 Tax=Persicirhabdus sediminis TaxID=454144 RepID=A0A8J7MIQ6_9BACT|nr:branched-chain-amino-acid transaminase [Persicirhabdus sediminis]MBK1792739.1 branched-chain-amino-acid transaminase [Persicirhabdus sediminis]